MVMHARKIPRLNDGYYDRGQSHSYEDKNSSKHRHYNDRLGDTKRDSSGLRHGGSSSGDGRGMRERNDSPSGRSSPRYQNKSSYMERNKDHASRGNSIDKRSNHDRSRSGKDGRNREQKQQDHRAEVRKSAMRVCGDWSEHVSSKGKCYYYNCKTEESKWEKPKEWTLPDEPRPRESKGQADRDRKMAPLSKKAHDDRPKHSSSGGTSERYRGDHHQNSRSAPVFGSPPTSRHHAHDSSTAHQMAPPSSRSSSELSQKYGRSSQSVNSLSNNNGGQCGAHRTSSHGAHSRGAEGKVAPSDRTDRTFTMPESQGYDRHHHRLNSSGSNAPASWHGGYRSGHKADHNGAKHHRNDDEDSRQAEDMDISPGSTPTDESLAALHALLPHSHSSSTTPPTASQKNSVASLLATLTTLASSSGGGAGSDLTSLAALSGLVATSPGGSTTTSPSAVLPQLLQQLASSARASGHGGSSSGGKGGSQHVLQQAIQVLQKLQENLVAQQKQQQQRQMQQLLVAQLAQLQSQLQTQQQPPPQRSHHGSSARHSSGSHGHKVPPDEGSQSPYSPPDESDGTPLQSPEHNNTGHHHPHHHHSDRATTPTNIRSHPTGGRESPRSDHSIKSSRRESPTHSHTSSQNLSSVGTSQLSAAHRNDESVHLTPSLANYYDETIIGHVSGLIYDQLERQADCVMKDAHVIGGEMVTQVSADLKGARSMVRVGEIISTLHEQRILFIRQQIKDLDSWRTHSTFNATSDAT